VIQAVVNYYSETTNINNLENIMKLIHDSINIAETKDLETLKNQVKACIFIKLQEKDMDGFFGDVCRYAITLNKGGNFYEFDRLGWEDRDWHIMKECFHNAVEIETLVFYKYAVWRDNEGWRCVSRRKSGLEYLWTFFDPEMEALKECANTIIQKIYESKRQTAHEQKIAHVFFSRFEDWVQIIAKAKELRSVK